MPKSNFWTAESATLWVHFDFHIFWNCSKMKFGSLWTLFVLVWRINFVFLSHILNLHTRNSLTQNYVTLKIPLLKPLNWTGNISQIVTVISENAFVISYQKWAVSQITLGMGYIMWLESYYVQSFWIISRFQYRS